MKQWDKVNWLHQPKGGYGYTMPIAGVIVKLNAQTVKIAVYSLIDKTVHYRNVKREHLTPRTQQSVLDEVFEVEMEA